MQSYASLTRSRSFQKPGAEEVEVRWVCAALGLFSHRFGYQGSGLDGLTIFGDAIVILPHVCSGGELCEGHCCEFVLCAEGVCHCAVEVELCGQLDCVALPFSHVPCGVCCPVREVCALC